MVKILLIPLEEFRRVRAAAADKYERLTLLADMCRANTLATVKRAGSGHLGSSFSSLDVVTMLYYSEMNTAEVGVADPGRDIYFSSKGHDAPGLYSVLFALGIIPRDQFIRLRRLGGTHGHPDIGTPGIEANTGSLGLGLSKAKGMAFAKKLRGLGGRLFVMTGDGELQEGQIYEALQSAAHQRITNLHVIVDHNKVQSDKLVDEIISLADLEAKLRSFGWQVSRCDGHDFRQLDRVFTDWRKITNRPKILIADTIKGRGVSFMEHPAALKAGGGIYRWHAGAPDDESYARAHEELLGRINTRLQRLGLSALALEELPQEPRAPSGVSTEYVAEAFGQALVELAAERKDLVVLDGDLAADCRVRAFEKKFPERFIENGIAEQDMVSMAGGLALQGLLPVVNSFASFLAARANEQIYNNSCERTKIIYVCHYAGLIPAGPGSSHQSVRDISLFGALPDCLIVEPCNAAETRMALNYCVNEAKGSCVLRLVIGPSPRVIPLPERYSFTPGLGVALTEGSDAALFAYGPVMLHEALCAAEILGRRGIGLKVVNTPWLNRIDPLWLQEEIGPCAKIFTLDDHAPVGGLGDALLNALAGMGLLKSRRFTKIGVEGNLACGTPQEALRHHGLDGESLARRVAECE
jgi:transketolase